jgi:hypothetical protein
VERVKEITETAFRGSLELVNCTVLGITPNGYNIPPAVPNHCINEFFVGLCHTYTEVERHNIFVIKSRIEFINQLIEKLLQESKDDNKELQRNSLNILNVSVVLYFYCTAFLKGENRRKDQGALELAEELNLNSTPYLIRLREDKRRTNNF